MVCVCICRTSEPDCAHLCVCVFVSVELLRLCTFVCVFIKDKQFSICMHAYNALVMQYYSSILHILLTCLSTSNSFCSSPMLWHVSFCALLMCELRQQCTESLLYAGRLYLCCGVCVPGIVV